MTTVADAVKTYVTDPAVALAMRLGAVLEGGTLGAGPFAPGDNGTSFGPYQIHLPAHPGVTAAQANDPAFAVRYMLPEYTSAAAKVDPALWKSNPEAAAEQTAYMAERPAQDYVASRGQATVDSAWSKATGSTGTAGVGAPGTVGSGDTSTPSTGSTSSGGGGGGTSLADLIGAGMSGLGLPLGGLSGSSLWNVLGLRKLVVTGVLLTASAGLVVLGTYRAATGRSAVKDAANTAGQLMQQAPKAAAVAA